MYPGIDQIGQAPAVDTSLVMLAIYSTLILITVIGVALMLAVISLPLFFGAMYLMELAIRGFQNMPDPMGKYSKLAGLVFRSLRRNLLRTALTYVALFVLTFMLSFIFSAVQGIDKMMAEKEGQQMVIMTEKFGIPSMMPPGYIPKLKDIIREKLPPGSRPDDIDKHFMTWSFIGGTLNPEKMTKENSLTLFAIQPDAIAHQMMSEQGLKPDNLGDENWAEMLKVIDIVKEDKRNIVVSVDRLEATGKRVGDEVTVHCLNYAGITFECKIVGAFPAGTRMSGVGAIRFDYLVSKLDEYQRRTGKPHPVADRCVNLIWVRMPNKESYQQLASIVNDPATFAAPAVKMETFSAAIGSFMEPLKEIFWGVKYIIMPAIFVIMCLVIGITITISVRERWSEMAVMKVLGFQPWQIMTMIVSESVLVGIFGGLLSTWSVYFLPMLVRSASKATGVKASFFETFHPPMEIAIYGPLLGIAVGLIGAVLPAWNARKVKVSEVFAKVA